MLEASPIYHPRNPFQSPLWNILHNNNYEELKANYDESYERQYGFFRYPIFAFSHNRLYRRCHKAFADAEADNSLEICK
ncbi:MAG: hypothetical protein C4B58_06160 [Deltaproteobacteria bacterium]|nr:MAG: hypothetical protein C4B58_06160 [Deltaproteobacteria bacterium]